MTRKNRIEKVKKLLAGETERPTRVYRVVERNGIKNCSDPGWPDDVQPQDIVIHVTVI